MKPELPAHSETQRNSTAEWIKAWRFRWALVAVAVSLTTKLIPFGSATWLFKGYGHDVATSACVFMLARSIFPSAALCAAMTLTFFLLGETFQYFQYLIPQHWIPQQPGQRRAAFGVFDPWDYLAFTLGTAIAWAIDSHLTRRALTK